MNREKRILNTMKNGVTAAIIIGILAIAALLLAPHLKSSDLLTGVGTGLLVMLPVSLILMTLRGYRKMDEFGQLITLKACSVALMVVMGLCMVYFPLQMVLHLPALPLWIIWVVGSVTYGIAMAVLSR
ncbi:hypothetical protein [Deinococcus misasensis]|uniref:hypothetical protein n=1 Tax=Deinococcus misasensis TaxID=392413 RepID=UPI0005540683|nr:hypothetical protein [Deinococcus misasensis]